MKNIYKEVKIIIEAGNAAPKQLGSFEGSFKQAFAAAMKKRGADKVPSVFTWKGKSYKAEYAQDNKVSGAVVKPTSIGSPNTAERFSGAVSKGTYGTKSKVSPFASAVSGKEAGSAAASKARAADLYPQKGAVNVANLKAPEVKKVEDNRTALALPKSDAGVGPYTMKPTKEDPPLQKASAPEVRDMSGVEIVNGKEKKLKKEKGTALEISSEAYEYKTEKGKRKAMGLHPETGLKLSTIALMRGKYAGRATVYPVIPSGKKSEYHIAQPRKRFADDLRKMRKYSGHSAAREMLGGSGNMSYARYTAQRLLSKYKKQRGIKEDVLDEAYKLGSMVVPNSGPHKGIKHKIVYAHPNGTFSIKPTHVKGSKNMYRYGKALATKAHLTPWGKTVKEEIITEAKQNVPYQKIRNTMYAVPGEVSRTEDGHIIVRQPYGKDSKAFASEISKHLTKAGIGHTIVDHGRKTKPLGYITQLFRYHWALRSKGAKGESHVWAKIKVHDNQKPVNEGKYEPDYEPKIGDYIATRRGNLPGKIGKVVNDTGRVYGHVVFTHPSGKKYKTPIRNIRLEPKVKDMFNEENDMQEAKQPSPTQRVRDAVYDEVSRTKNGHVMVRRQYFYTHGVDSEKFANGISKQLTKAGVKHTVIDHGEVWKPFRGGAPTKASSHWWARIKVHDEQKPVNESTEQKHRVAVTVIDPSHPMVTKRKEKQLKYVRISAESKSGAIQKAINYYTKMGYKVHDTQHVGMTGETFKPRKIKIPGKGNIPEVD